MFDAAAQPVRFVVFVRGTNPNTVEKVLSRSLHQHSVVIVASFVLFSFSVCLSVDESTYLPAFLPRIISHTALGDFEVLATQGHESPRGSSSQCSYTKQREEKLTVLDLAKGKDAKKQLFYIYHGRFIMPVATIVNSANNYNRNLWRF